MKSLEDFTKAKERKKQEIVLKIDDLKTKLAKVELELSDAERAFKKYSSIRAKYERKKVKGTSPKTDTKVPGPAAPAPAAKKTSLIDEIL